jgi:polyphenol oxidase
MLYQPLVFRSFPQIVAAQSDRHGGVSMEPFASLNLGWSSGDEREKVLENRRIFFGSLGIGLSQIALSHQVHGREILRADQPGNYEGYDALITNRPGLFVAVSIADCVPVLLFDPENQAVVAIHAGWRGTQKAVVAAALQQMQVDFGTKPQDCTAYIGTCISECSFEVNADVADLFESDFKRYDPDRQKFFIDLKKANKAQLTLAGVPESQIEVSPFCTVLNHENHFSYRHEKGKTGRMMAVIGIKN